MTDGPDPIFELIDVLAEGIVALALRSSTPRKRSRTPLDLAGGQSVHGDDVMTSQEARR
jgi:hypothetical protein